MRKGQLIESMPLEGISYIKVRVAIVGLWIVGILPTLIASAASPARRVHIVEEVGPDVAEAVVESMAHTLLDNGLQRVVVPDRIQARGLPRDLKRSTSP